MVLATALIPLLPLLAALICGLFGKDTLRGRSHWPVWIAIAVGFAISFILLLGQLFTGDTTNHHPPTTNLHWFTWIDAGSFTANAGALIDSVSLTMLNVVTGIGLLIAIFAAGYMKGEEGYWRFFAYVALFIFAMTVLVMGDNLVLLFLGWEGVGLCSYLLIGYDLHKPEAAAAAKKAFIANRVGDFGFLVGIMLIFYCFGTVSYFGPADAPGFLHSVTSVVTHSHGWAAGFQDLMPGLPASQVHWRVLALYAVPFFLMLGAFGKSAQFPLYVWLPDAMAGPTPVSALIHAATMVTAGIYMIVRLAPVFYGNPQALIVIAVIGTFTAVLAATIALRQFDLKKVFAYSTVSQLGFMFVGVACLAPVAGMFHLVTHAFFKALLFLSSGVVMHGMLGHLDIRKMSGLGNKLPRTKWLMLAGCLALAGFPLTAGFWSKDSIVHAAGFSSHLAQWILLGTAFLTAYYTFRVWFQIFTGPELVPSEPAEDHGDVSPADTGHDAPSHGDPSHDHPHNHEPLILIAPLALLAIGALLVGFINTPAWPALGEFLGSSESLSLGYDVAHHTFRNAQAGVIAHGFGQHDDAHAPSALMGLIVGGLVSLLGISAAWYVHSANRGMEQGLVNLFRPFATIFEGKYWIDELYRDVIYRPLAATGRGLNFADKFIVDGAVWVASFSPQLTGFGLKLFTQRGALQGYGVLMLAGVAVLMLVLMM